MSKIKIGAQVTAKAHPTKVTVSGTFQGYELEDQEDPTSICGKVFYIKDGKQHLAHVYIDSIEVCDSEDERTRRELLNFIEAEREHSPETVPGKHWDRWITYLEKQKEQKSEEKISVSEELYEHIRNTCACIDDAMSSDTMCDMTDYLTMADSSAQKAFDMVERLIIKKPAESDAIKGGDFISDGKRVFLVLANVKERNLGETGSTFCEGHILGVDGVVYCDGGDFKKFKRATSDERAKFIHDLKAGVKLKEQPAEWSEEDDACYETIKGILEDNLTEEDKPEYVLSWFKTHYSHSRWKPSEKQMKVLDKVYHYLWADENATADMQDGLGDFIDELKSL